MKNKQKNIFLLIGIIGFLPKKDLQIKNNFLNKLCNSKLNYIFIISIFIMVGEIGDKTFLVAIGLGIDYPYYKLSLIAGCTLGMIISNSVVILFGKLIEKCFSNSFINLFSNLIFIIFGLIGLLYT